MSVRDVLILGNFRGASRSALTTATNSLRLNVVEFTGVDEAIAALDVQPWHAILVDTTLSGASRFCAEARALRSLFDVPLIALSPRLTDLAFLNALRWGADDVVALGAAEPLAVRLSSLVTNRAVELREKDRGIAVVADPDRRRGDGLGRALHLAGYSVKYANDPVSARYYLAKSDTDLYVLNAELADPAGLIGTSEQSAHCRCVVLAKPTQLVDLEQQFHGNRNVVVMSSGGPPENVLFAVNLLFPNEASKRGETRALFGTVVFFRAVGDYRDECGFSYTASPQGIYVRTLAPAPSDKVWVELIPPDGERRVRLVGRVAWSRPFGSPGGEAAPPGFGVRIVDGLGEDLSLWSMCLRSLEFRAPATLVPEARFSTPMSRLSSPDDLRPYVIGQHEPVSPSHLLEQDTTGEHAHVSAITPPQPVLATGSGASPGAEEITATNGVAQTKAMMPTPVTDPVVTSASPVPSAGAQKTGANASLSNPPASLPLSRLRHPSNQVSTRPSLRLSVPGPTSAKRESLLRSGRLSRAPQEGAHPAEPAAVPSRSGQGQTVLGLGLLKRDGSVEDNPTPALTTSKTSDLPNSTEPTERRSLEPYIVSPVTGRTLNYGSATNAPTGEKPTFPPNDWDDDTARTSLIDDISDRPTLTDRLSAPQNSAPQNSAAIGATATAEREPFITSAATTRSSVAPTADVFDSIPPEALESDAPLADPDNPARAPLLRRDPVARTYFGEPPDATDAGLHDHANEFDRGSDDLFSAAERELESATRASIPAGGTLPGFVSPAASSLAVARPRLNSGEVAPDTDPEAPLTTQDTDHLSSHAPLSAPSPFEAALVTPLPPNKEISEVEPTQTITINRPAPKRAVWFGIAAALCGVLVLVLLVRRTQMRVARNVDPIAAPQKVTEPTDSDSRNSPPEPNAIVVPHGTGLVPPSAIAAATEATGTTETGEVLSSTAVALNTHLVPSANAPTTISSQPLGERSPTAMSASIPHTEANGPFPNPTRTSASLAVSNEQSAVAPVFQVASSPPKAPQELPAKNAWLYVRSELDARVFVHGIDSGVTNTWIETPCGTRFIRLGRSLGDWLGQGFPTVIRCRNNNIVDGAAQ